MKRKVRTAVASIGAIALATVVFVCRGTSDSSKSHDPGTPFALASTACAVAKPSLASTVQDTDRQAAKGSALYIRYPAVPVLTAGTDGSASATFDLCLGETATAPASLKPQLGLLRGETGDGTAYVASAQGSVSSTTTKLAPGACVPAEFKLARLQDPGPLRATLRNAGTEVAEIKVANVARPLSLEVLGTNPKRVDLTMTRGKAATVAVRNPSEMTEHIRWRWELGGNRCTGTLSISPGATRNIHVLVQDSDFGWLDSALRPAAASGRLVIDRDLGEGFGHVAIKPIDLPTEARLNYFGSIGQPVVNALGIVVLLVTGVLASLGINFALPMQRKRVATKDNLAELAATLNGQGSQIGSRTLNVLRVEIGRLNAAVGAQWPWFPEIEAQLTRIDKRLELLKERLRITHSVSSCRADVRGRGTALLTLHEAEAALSHCDTALKLVELGAPSSEDLKRAESELAAANQIIAAAAAPPDAAALGALQRRIERLPETLDGLEPGTGDAVPIHEDHVLWKSLGTMLAKAHSAFKLVGKNGANPDRLVYVSAAKALWKAELIQEYSRLVVASESPKIYRARLDKGQALLLALQPGESESPRVARGLLRQIDQNVSDADIKRALMPADGFKPRIEVSPRTPLPFQLVMLRVELPSPALNDAAARDAFQCEWKVDGVPLDTRELSIYHSFERKPNFNSSPFRIDATVRDAKDNPYPIDHETVTLAEGTNFGRSNTLLSITGLAVTVIAVVLGLLAVAQDKLQSLDWFTGVLTVLAIGFGADVVKRAISKSS